MLELLINQDKDIKTIMLVENGILVEKHEEHKDEKRLEGNIYIGKIVNILPGMQSAFIDIGIERTALIKVKDVLPKIDETKNQCKEEKNIQDILKENEDIVVQIKKEGTKSKGAKLSTHIKIPGRLVVLMPDCDIITISQKICNENEKIRLKEIAKKVLPENMGIIMRTSSEGISEDTIKEDINILLKKWKQIEKYKKQKNKAPTLLYDNNTFIRRTLIDILDRGLQKIIVNNKQIYETIQNILNELKVNEVKIELKQESLFEMYTLSKQIEDLEKRKIWLKCGGFITIDKTEALTAIDVNSGKYTGKQELEKTIYKVNQEATIEIAKQLRLRDIGGIIIIDYIDMHIEENKANIERLLKDCLNKDRSKCQLGGFTRMNLYEMTRKNLCSQSED